MDRFTRKTSLGYEVDPRTNVCAIQNALGKYEDAEDAGTLVRLPCVLGTQCYYANPALHEVCPSEIIGFEINKYTNPSLWIEFEYISRWVGGNVRKIREDSAFGKLLFFTKEEAEQALKGGAR